MRKLALATLLFFIITTLTSCNIDSKAYLDLDYSDFQESIVTSYQEAETIENERYALFYYDSTSLSNTLKNEILNFFYDFSLFSFYLLDTSSVSDESSYTEDKAVYIIADGEIIESYSLSNINSFIDKYTNLDDYELEYDYFKTQFITTYQEALNIDSDAYILYYYLDNCPHCIRAKQDVLHWAIQRDVRDIYFINGQVISNDGSPPTELLILNSGTPILVIMSNGEFANEFYSGTDPVIEYITNLGLDEITTENLNN